MFSIPILIPDEMPLHSRRSRHPYTTQCTCHRPAHWGGSFQDFAMMPSSIQADNFPCCHSTRPCRSRSPRRPKEEHSDFTQRLISDLFGDLFLPAKEEQREQKNKDACRKKMPKSDVRKFSGEKSTNEANDTMVDDIKESQHPRFQKWRHNVDCSGFKSENIYVKVLEGSIIVRGEKEEHDNGTVSVTSTEKHIKIPQNLEAKNITCRLLPNSRLLIEAPYINDKNGKETPSIKPLSNSSKFLQYSCPLTLHYTEDKGVSDSEPGEIDSSITPREDSSEEKERNFKPEKINKDDQQDNDVQDNDDSCSHASNTSDESFVVISEKENKGEVCILDKSKKIEETEVDPDQQHKICTENSGNICNTSNEIDLNSCSKTSDLQSEDKSTLSKDVVPTKEFQVRLELMYHSPESIRVIMDDRTRHINILARRDNDNYSESVLKEVSVPDTVDIANLRCYFQDGLLTIAAPFKTTVTGTRDIPIKM